VYVHYSEGTCMVKSHFPFRKFLGAIRNNLKYLRKFVIDMPGSRTPLQFMAINYVTWYRWDTFFTKEPETLAWIDKMNDDSIFWDVGANVGVYSIYFLATKKNGRVVAFEPHPSNVAGLVDNLRGNSLLNDRVTIVANPLFSDTSTCNFNMSSTVVGDSHHTASKSSSQSCFQSLAMTLSTPLSYGLPCPDFLKVDVDGNELEIMASAGEILSNTKLKGVLIEIEFANAAQAASIIAKLNKHGFREMSRVDTNTRLGKDASKQIHNVIFAR